MQDRGNRGARWPAIGFIGLTAAFGYGYTCTVQGRLPSAHIVVPEVLVQPPPPARFRIEAPRVVPGAVVLQPQCDPGRPEVLNGIDDNCNGQVDEGFVGSGTIQVTLWWQTGADIDLYVSDPTGEEVSYRNRQNSTGGVLDHDSRGSCTDGRTIENVFWNTPRPPSGPYRVDVHYYSSCGAAGPTPVVVSVVVGGQIVGSYQYTLQEGQRVTLAAFQLP